ncbi:hypothetical protein BU25DRAFT_76363 [Macroventuria anomochaeta]|uniref:Uncharacterized protein n=1 Tax=Macroventuria anomochaeta TaxID=301207 RepID=A0ACB6SG02_9PLEO|nr:uncharacterized protein BU25DRAFT_76363 [Macroventuria anomochaeta]KAF2632515.1 hypothetical protein BU25DRAFT_76363 [Macroventuria anomochaeta]
MFMVVPLATICGSARARVASGSNLGPAAAEDRTRSCLDSQLAGIAATSLGIRAEQMACEVGTLYQDSVIRCAVNKGNLSASQLFRPPILSCGFFLCGCLCGCLCGYLCSCLRGCLRAISYFLWLFHTLRALNGKRGSGVLALSLHFPALLFSCFDFARPSVAAPFSSHTSATVKKRVAHVQMGL